MSDFAVSISILYAVGTDKMRRKHVRDTIRGSEFYYNPMRKFLTGSPQKIMIIIMICSSSDFENQCTRVTEKCWKMYFSKHFKKIMWFQTDKDLWPFGIRSFYKLQISLITWWVYTRQITKQNWAERFVWESYLQAEQRQHTEDHECLEIQGFQFIYSN